MIPLTKQLKAIFAVLAVSWSHGAAPGRSDLLKTQAPRLLSARGSEISK